jgi:hypothetical protein
VKIGRYYLFLIGLISCFHVWAISPLGDIGCGQVGQFACGLTSSEYWKSASCDQGLKRKGLLCVMGKRLSSLIKKDSWVSKSLLFQRSLAKNFPLNQTFFFRALGTELSSKVNEKGKGRQDFSLTDLLNLGIRSLSVEVHFFDDLLRVCLEECGENERPWFSWIEELSLWVRKNPSEIVLVDLVDKVKDKGEDLVSPIIFHFSPIMFKPSMKKENPWPSSKTLLEKDMRVVFFNDRSHNKDIFHLKSSYFLPSLENRAIGYWDGVNCTLKGKKLKEIRSFNQHGWVGFEDTRSEIGDGDNGSSVKTITTEKIKTGLKCDMTLLSTENLNPEKVEAGVWSWAKGKPVEKEDETCIFINKEGRWDSSLCEEQRHFACYNNLSTDPWMLTEGKGKWEEGEAFCQGLSEEFKFSKPQNGKDNQYLFGLLKNNSGIWVNNLIQKDKWPGQYMIVPSVSGRPLIGWHKNVRQWSWLNRSFQRWSLVSRDEDYYLLKNQFDESCMSVAESLTENAANVILKECQGTDEQLWKLEDKGNGLFWIKNKLSQKCLDLEKTKKSNFDSAMQWSCHDVSQHKFHLFKIR